MLLLGSWQAQKKGGSKDPWGPFREINWLKLGAVLIGLVVYALLFEWAGALVSTAVFMGVLMQTIEPKKWYVVTFFSVASSFSTYILFKVLLNVRLPSGFFGF